MSDSSPFSSVVSQMDFLLGKFKGAYKETSINDVFYLDLKAPLGAQFELTAECNYNCIFCYNHWRDKPDNTISDRGPDFRRAVLQKLISDFEVFDIIFSGGEPLLVKDIFDLVRTCKTNNVETTLITNGSLLTKDVAQRLRDAGLCFIQISLHHLDDNLSDKITQSENSATRTLEGIKNALGFFSSNNIGVNMVPTVYSYQSLDRLILRLHSLGIDSISISSPTFTGKALSSRELFVDKEKFLFIYRQMRKVKKELPDINLSIVGGFPRCILPEDDGKINFVNICDAALHQVVVDPVGNMKACVCLENQIGNILDDDALIKWKNSRFFNDLRKFHFLPKKCKACKQFVNCRGGCRASALGYYGDISAEDPLLR